MMGDELMRGEKVRLALPGDDYLDLMTQWYTTDFGMMRNLGARPVYPLVRVDQEKWLRASMEDENSFVFAIRSLVADIMLGLCALFSVDWRSRHTELAIVLGAAQKRGQGFGRDAVQVMLRYSFMELNLHRVYLAVHSDNPRAIRSYEAVGFVHEGAVRQSIYRDGEYHDLLWMSVLASEWRAA